MKQSVDIKVRDPDRRTRDISGVERKVFETFSEEIPSLYFSDKESNDAEKWIENNKNLYHDWLNFPPKMFEGCSLADFGAGTGENTIQFAKWGANCTLIDINQAALNIAKEVFRKHTSNPRQHRFLKSSIFDYRVKEQFDIVVTNGVLHHTDSKELAFSKIANCLKAGGYFIFGIGNKAGQFQNMLQRLIIYSLADNDTQIEQVAEYLFKEDIDRSQLYSKRSRRAIIYDRFVVQKQDDPSISEVFKWFRSAGLTYYSSYPPVLPAVLSDSHLHPPSFKFDDVPSFGSLVEASWLIHQYPDNKQVPQVLETLVPLAVTQHQLTNYVNDFNIRDEITVGMLKANMKSYQSALDQVNISSLISKQTTELFLELSEVLDILSGNGDIEVLRSALSRTKKLFRGANGVRHMFYIAHKPN